MSSNGKRRCAESCPVDCRGCEAVLRCLAEFPMATLTDDAGSAHRGRIVGVSPRRRRVNVIEKGARLLSLSYDQIDRVRAVERDTPLGRVGLLLFEDSRCGRHFRVELGIRGALPEATLELRQRWGRLKALLGRPRKKFQKQPTTSTST